MDRINKFLNARQQKNQKTLKYKNEKFVIKKEDLKMIRSYKSGKCLDPAIKSIPSRKLDMSELPAQKGKQKKDASEYFNKKLLEHYRNNPTEKVIIASKNEIVDIWETEGLDDLKNYTQEWIYSITEQYEGKVADLNFTKEHLEDELKRVYMKHFRPRDPKMKAMRDILPKLPEIEQLRPYPEHVACEWTVYGQKHLFSDIACSLHENRVVMKDFKYNKIIFDQCVEKELYKLAYCDGDMIVSTKEDIFMKTRNELKPIIHTEKAIKDIYIDKTFIGLLTSKSVTLYDTDEYKEIKILKLKGDTLNKIKIYDNVVYTATHKGIAVDSQEDSTIKNLGYVIDFVVSEDSIYAINNLGRLMVVDKNLKTVRSVVQTGIGVQIKYHACFCLLAILFTHEIGIYKVINNECVPINTITGSFKAIEWNEHMPWLYAAQKQNVYLLT